jgi:uncharacterized membrane protein YgcG
MMASGTASGILRSGVGRSFFRAALAVVLLVWAAPQAHAAEEIRSFHSDIRIQADGSLEVTETIEIRAEGLEIRRGIVREFPTRYRDQLGNRVRVDFELLGVERDGRPEPHFIERVANGVEINTGTDDFLKVPATYSFRLRYRTARQLGFFEGHDELYWNVTGTGWIFPILKASATVHLPRDAPIAELTAEGYTGPQGAVGRDLVAEVVAPDEIRFAATRPLGIGEGLTIVAGFPKGLVAEPSQGRRLLWLLYDNRGLLIALAGLVLLLIYYGVTWWRVGRDPKAGPIFPHYSPPAGHSPAGLRYLSRMDYDQRCFAADLVEMAVKGYLRIHQEKSGWREVWRLERLPGGDPALLTPGQAALGRILFSKGDNLVLTNKEADKVAPARNAHTGSLAGIYQPRYLLAHKRVLIVGICLSLLYGVLAWRTADGAGIPAMLVLFGLAVGAHALFARLLKAPTPEGRALLDQVEGLKLYLSVAERDELKSLPGPGSDAPPVLDAARYEALLPYALALDVEDAWTRKFTLAVGAAAAAAAAGGMQWYSGRGTDLSRVSRSLGKTLSRQIASSATPPGSRSGGGGGGSSGGGGGGGGGRGR